MLQTAISTQTPMDWTPAFQSPAPCASPLEALDKLGTRITVKRGEEIYAEGDDAAYCYKLISGCVRLVKLMSSGERQICEFIVPGDLMGFEAQDEHYFSSEAVIDAVLIRYPRRAAERLINDSPAAARFVRKLTSSSLQGAYERMVLLCHKSAQERMAWFLLEMAERSKGTHTDCVELPMTRSDIADYLGMVIETVSRVLTQLRQKGVIAMRGVNSIRLVDRDGLEDIASAA